MIFFFEKIQLIFYIKIDFESAILALFDSLMDIKKNPLSMLILGQKSCSLGPTVFKIPQPN